MTLFLFIFITKKKILLKKIKSTSSWHHRHTLQEEAFQLDLNFANGHYAKFKSRSLLDFRNLSMIAYRIEIQKSNFADI